ncbi:MAG TPA: RNA-binding cell elongation regulator Jag/EloR [Candidatus Limnocylindrales bacterium]
MSAYREFSGKSVEEALREAREAFGVGLDGLDFEILTPGTRGVLGMGAEPARIVAAPRAALGGTAPKREAAEATPLPAPVHDRDPDRDHDRDRGPRRDERERGGRRDEHRGEREHAGRGREFPGEGAREGAREFVREGAADGGRDVARDHDRAASHEGGRPEGRRDGGRRDDRDRGPRREDRGGRRFEAPRGRPTELTAGDIAELTAARSSVAAERADLEAAEASPEALAAAKTILEELMEHLGFAVRVDVETGETSRLNVTGEGEEKEALGALIGRKGERLSALQHLVNLMLSKKLGAWTRVLVDVEDYRGRRERQLREIAERAAARVAETGSILQLEPMPALERRWVHIALRENPDVVTQSIGEEPNRRIVILPRPA